MKQHILIETEEDHNLGFMSHFNTGLLLSFSICLLVLFSFDFFLLIIGLQEDIEGILLLNPLLYCDCCAPASILIKCLGPMCH